MLIPRLLIKFFPKLFQEDVKAIALANKMDSILTEWISDLINIKSLARPEEIPANLISELDFLLSANCQPNDTDTQRRIKVQTAVSRHKRRGTWVYDAKITIDLITGYDSRIWGGQYSDDWILCGDGVTGTSSDYWGSMGVDGVDDNLGLALIGDGTEWEVKGNVYINLHYGHYTAILSSDIIAEIITQIQDEVVPAYFRVYLGYIDVSGKFNLYPNGTIA